MDAKDVCCVALGLALGRVEGKARVQGIERLDAGILTFRAQ